MTFQMRAVELRSGIRTAGAVMGTALDKNNKAELRTVYDGFTEDAENPDRKIRHGDGGDKAVRGHVQHFGIPFFPVRDRQLYIYYTADRRRNQQPKQQLRAGNKNLQIKRYYLLHWQSFADIIYAKTI